jgi:hypothetical protein
MALIWRLPSGKVVINGSDDPLPRENEKSSCFRQPAADKRTHPQRFHSINRAPRWMVREKNPSYNQGSNGNSAVE